MKTILNQVYGQKTNSNHAIHLIIRGETFRKDVKSQYECIDSIINYIIKPIIVQRIALKISFFVYEHKMNKLLIEYLSKKTKNKFLINLVECDKSVIRTQADNFLLATDAAAKDEASSLIIRPDLIFKKLISLSRLNEDKFLFQWNHFHDYSINEIADQIHWVGNNISQKTNRIFLANRDKLGQLPNGEGSHTLHNLYNILCSHKNIKTEEIGYIFEYKLGLDDYNGSKCSLRGNPEVSKINDLYEYARILDNSSRIDKRIIRKFKNFF